MPFICNYVRQSFPQAPKGDRGETGPKGDIGPNGFKGDRGFKGFAGPKGPKGETAIPGSGTCKGDKGPVGPTGPSGPSKTCPSKTWQYEPPSFCGPLVIGPSHLPSDVTIIPDQAAWKCWNTQSVTIPKCAETIGTYAFGECPNLATVVFESATAPPPSASSLVIGIASFNDCAITSLIIPRNVTVISAQAFRYNPTLTSLTIQQPSSPTGALEIQDFAFETTGLSGTLDIPYGVTSIGLRAFANTQISQVKLPSNCTYTASGGDASFPPGCTIIPY